jgi:hypothetical protein
VIALWCATALANGQSTHIWITREAVVDLPAGELQDFLADPAVERALIAGAMFPDGGYAVDHPYGEAAHWEPFHDVYLAWILDNYDPPFTGEAALHLAFLLGLASHGMADETFDAHYFTWSRETDADFGWADGASFDEASDVIWCSTHGAQSHPEDPFVPYDLFVTLFPEIGIDVDRATMEDGFAALELAVDFVGFASTSPDSVAGYEAQFPWGGAHLDDPVFPGNPPDEARWVAAYWQSLWERAHDRPDPSFTLGIVPEPEERWGISRDHASERSAVSVITARGLHDDLVTADDFAVETADGAPIPFTVDVYYGETSHVIRLRPVDDWPLGDLTATMRGGFDGPTDGTTLGADFHWAFSTLPPPEPEPEPAVDGDPTAEEAPGGCTTGGGAASPLALLGAFVLRRRRITC